MRTDGQTDRHDEANTRFRSFANPPNNDYRVQDVAFIIPSVSQSAIYKYICMYVYCLRTKHRGLAICVVM